MGRKCASIVIRCLLRGRNCKIAAARVRVNQPLTSSANRGASISIEMTR